MKNPFLAPVRVNKDLHRGGDRSCLHIEFDLEGSKLRYDSGKYNRSDHYLSRFKLMKQIVYILLFLR